MGHPPTLLYIVVQKIAPLLPAFSYSYLFLLLFLYICVFIQFYSLYTFRCKFLYLPTPYPLLKHVVRAKKSMIPILTPTSTFTIFQVAIFSNTRLIPNIINMNSTSIATTFRSFMFKVPLFLRARVLNLRPHT